MTEPQRIEGRERAERPVGAEGGDDAGRGPVVEIAGRVLIPLGDGESWVLRAAPTPDAPRLALITVTERGYLSIDRSGEVRGPYVTLSEAAYPLARPDGELLGDPVDRPATLPPTSLAGERPRSSRTGRRRDVLLVLSTAVVAAAAARVIRIGGR